MAELATIARPYAEALYKAAGGAGAALKEQVASLAALAGLAHVEQLHWCAAISISLRQQPKKQ